MRSNSRGCLDVANVYIRARRKSDRVAIFDGHNPDDRHLSATGNVNRTVIGADIGDGQSIGFNNGDGSCNSRNSRDAADKGIELNGIAGQGVQIVGDKDRAAVCAYGAGTQHKILVDRNHSSCDIQRMTDDIIGYPCAVLHCNRFRVVS